MDTQQSQTEGLSPVILHELVISKIDNDSNNDRDDDDEYLDDDDNNRIT